MKSIIELKAIWFVQVPPSLSHFWKDDLINHCSERWNGLNSLRILKRIELESVQSITGTMVINEYPVENIESLSGEFLLKTDHNIFENELNGLDLSGDLDSVFFPVEKGLGVGLARWKMNQHNFGDGTFYFTTKTKLKRKNGISFIYED